MSASEATNQALALGLAFHGKPINFVQLPSETVCLLPRFHTGGEPVGCFPFKPAFFAASVPPNFIFSQQSSLVGRQPFQMHKILKVVVHIFAFTKSHRHLATAQQLLKGATSAGLQRALP
jgi:hypothetical protein